MGIVSSINYFINLIVDTFKQFGRGKIWLVLLIYSFLNWLILFVHYDFQSPLFYGLVNTWVSLMSPDEAVAFSHYPQQFILLPHYFGWAKFFFGLIFEGLFLGMAAMFFANSFRGSGKDQRFKTGNAFSCWLQLIFAWVILNGLLLLVNSFIPSLFQGFIEGSPRREYVFEFVLLPFIYTLLLCFFFFIIPSVVLFRENVFKAAKRSFLVFFRHPLTVFLLSIFVLVIPVLVSAVTGRPVVIVEKFRPELVYWVLSAGLFLDIIVNFFWMSTAVQVLVNEEE